jgi:hypothetical protein
LLAIRALLRECQSIKYDKIKTRNDFRLVFNKEKQLPVLVTDGTGFIHYSDDYVHWLEELAMKNESNNLGKQFAVTFRFLNNTDASLHEEIVSAESSEEALNIVCQKHKFNIEWSTIKELHF